MAERVVLEVQARDNEITLAWWIGPSPFSPYKIESPGEFRCTLLLGLSKAVAIRLAENRWTWDACRDIIYVMMASDPEELRVLPGLLAAVREQTQFSGIRHLLRAMAVECGADGLVWWRLRDRQVTPEHYLYCASSYFVANETPLFQDLSVNSPTAQVMARCAPDAQIVSETSRVPQYHPEHSLLQQYGVASFVTVPVLEGSRAPTGCLSFTFGREDVNFKEMKTKAEALARLFPLLVDTLMESVGNKLLNRVSHLQIQSQHTSPANRIAGVQPQWDRAMAEIGRVLQEVFEMYEYAIYVRTNAVEKAPIKWIAGHWPWKNRDYKKSYEEAEGVTGYCLRKRTRIIIEDIVTYFENRNELDREGEYPGMKPTWQLSEVTTALAPHAKTGALPPVPLICIPLQVGTEVVGVMRICGFMKAPYFVDQVLLKCLDEVGLRIGQWLWAQLRLAEIAELRVRETAAFALTRMLTKSYRSNMSDPALEYSLSRTTVDQLHALDTHIDAAVFRKYQDADGQATLTIGFEWRRDGRLPIPPSIRVGTGVDAGAWTRNTRGICSIPDTRASGQVRLQHEFGFRSLVVAYVSPGGAAPLGTLEIYSKGPHTFSQDTVTALERVAEELGRLAWTIDLQRKERNLLAERRKETRELHDGLENLQHQIKTPVRLLSTQIRTLVKSGTARVTRDDLKELEAAARRGLSIVNNVEMYTTLARGEALRVTKPERLTRSAFVKRLDETCALFEVGVDPVRDVQCQVRSADFEPLDWNVVQAEEAMVDQVLDILLDNAIKYGDDHSKIEIGAGLIERNQKFYLSISNSGQEISPQEISRLTERGRRSERVVKGKKGAGLGLYIAQEIMEAHHGRLDVIPKQKMTEVRAVFPVGEVYENTVL